MSRKPSSFLWSTPSAYTLHQPFSSLFKPPTSSPSPHSLLNPDSLLYLTKEMHTLAPELSPLPAMKLINQPHICTLLFHSPHRKAKESLPIFGDHSLPYSLFIGSLWKGNVMICDHKCMEHLKVFTKQQLLSLLSFLTELCPRSHSKDKTINPYLSTKNQISMYFKQKLSLLPPSPEPEK